MRRPSPPSLMLSLLLGTGCASSPLLSSTSQKRAETEQYMLDEISRDFRPGTEVLVHAVGPELRIQASGTIAEWNAADRTLVLEDCRVREKPSNWVSRSPFLEWAQRDEASPQVPVAHLSIPVGEIKSIGPVAGSLLQQERPGILATPFARQAPPLTPEQEQQNRDRERRIRAAASPPF